MRVSVRNYADDGNAGACGTYLIVSDSFDFEGGPTGARRQIGSNSNIHHNSANTVNWSCIGDSASRTSCCSSLAVGTQGATLLKW